MTTQEAYKNNEEFKEYVDRYCQKKDKELSEVLQYQIVRDYLEYLLQKN